MRIDIINCSDVDSKCINLYVDNLDLDQIRSTKYSLVGITGSFYGVL